MRNKVIWSFLSLVALATGGLLSGCDSDAKIAKSSPGESCTKTSDCEENLRCLEGTCYKSSTSTGGSANAGGEGNTAGTTPVAPKPPVLGKLGESCARRADCVDGLACLSMRCSEDVVVGAGGEGSGGPALGGPGETCGLTSDCSEGLTCLPSDSFVATAIGSNSVGVCAVTDNGLEPTGKSCHGAECLTAEDCCELPIEVQIANASAPTYGVGVNSCAELAKVLDGVDCDATSLTTVNAARCFAQTAYCECAKNTWACGATGHCEYKASCSKNYGTPGGCPTYSRAGYALTSACDIDGTEKCQPAAAVPTCKVDADCEGEIVADNALETCTGGECTCYKTAGLCYRKCGEDLDCEAGKVCDDKLKLCVAAPTCESNAFCVTRMNDIHSKCVDGLCDTTCETDLDCNYGSLIYGNTTATTRVCNATHHCEAVGCETDQECPGTAAGVKLFCTETPALVATAGVFSAKTD
jgi:hypothetical protein